MVTDKKGMSTVNITPDDEVADVGALYQIAPKRAWAPTRRSKTKATAFIAEKAPQLGSDDSSEDEDFAPKFVPLEDEDQSVGGDDGPLEAATTNGDSDDEGAPSIAESEAVHNEEWGTYRRFNRDEYIGPKKPEPIVPVRKTVPMNFARHRAQIIAKKRTKQALKIFAKRAARQEKVIRRAKEELRAEAKKTEIGTIDEVFWTRGKHDVKLEEVRAQVNFTGAGNDIPKDEWKNIIDENWSGKKDGGNTKSPRKSRKVRRDMVRGGSKTDGKGETASVAA